MTHQITYQAESDVADWTTAKAIADSAQTFADNNVDRTWQGVGYDDVGGTMRVSLLWGNVADIDATLDTLDSGIQSINTDHGTSFPLASDTATIKPE